MTSAGEAVDPRTLRRWRRAIIAAFGFGGITLSAWGPRLPAIKSELRIDTATIGLLVAGLTVGGIAGLFVSTPTLHRFGARRGVTVSLLFMAASLGAIGAAVGLRSVPLLGICFVVLGGAIGVLDVAINVEGSAIEQAAGRTLMPRMHAAWSIGAAIGSGIGAACAALGLAPAEQFVGEAVVIASAALAMAAAIPAGRRSGNEEPAATRGVRFKQWLSGWADWRLLMIGVVMLGVELGEGSANNWLSLAARNDHGESASIAALFLAVFAASEGTTRLLGGPVVDRLGRVRTIRVTTALGVGGVVLFVLGTAPWVVLVGVVLWAVGVSMGFPLGMSAAAEGGANPAARVSVVASIGYFASLAGPPVIGVLAQSAGLLHALWLVAALFVVAFAVAGALGGRPPATSSAPGPPG